MDKPKKISLVFLIVIGMPFTILGVVIGFILERLKSGFEIGDNVIFHLWD